MWGTKTLARARRQLGLRGHRPAEPPVEPQLAPPDTDETKPITVVLTRSEMDALATALEDRLGRDTPRLDSPARVEAALADVIGRAGGRGLPAVVRSPAGLHTPEYWHLRIDAADTVTRTAVERFIDARRID